MSDQTLPATIAGDRIAPEKWLVLGAVCLAAIMMPLSFVGPSVALPAIGREFGGSAAALNWVLNAFILTGYDLRRGHLGEVTRTAFDNAWALQTKDGPDAGAWVWQNFGLAPWESKESQYHWAALMAVTVAKAPDHYRDDPKIAANLAALTGYLRGHYETQPVLNKVVALWASAYYPDVLSGDERAALIATLSRLQHPDGGWSLTDLGPWTRVDKSPAPTGSDGYGTAVTVLVLEEIGLRGDPRVARGLAWLEANQDRSTGAWTSLSVNKARDPTSPPGPFMTDAATSFAVLALEDRR